MSSKKGLNFFNKEISSRLKKFLRGPVWVNPLEKSIKREYAKEEVG
jgi:hypothetical protein